MSGHSLFNVNMQIFIIYYSAFAGCCTQDLLKSLSLGAFYPKFFLIFHLTSGIRYIDLNFSQCLPLQLIEVPISIAYEAVNCCQCLFVGAFESILVLGRHCCLGQPPRPPPQQEGSYIKLKKEKNSRWIYCTYLKQV
jgi:hypothetical protein